MMNMLPDKLCFQPEIARLFVMHPHCHSKHHLVITSAQGAL